MRALLAAGLVAMAAGASPAQQAAAPSRAAPLRISSAVAPETVTVGDRFRSVLQVVAPPGSTVEFSPLPVADTLQPVDSLRVVPGRAGEPPLAVYSLIAWVAGAPLRAQAQVRVVGADGAAATYLVPLRLPVVRSVLPADTAGVEPRPARGLLPLARDERSWWWLALVGLLVALAGVAWLLLRRRPAAPADAGTPRQRALAELERVTSGVAAGVPEVVYPAVTRVLRRYLAELAPGWSADLTTRELLARMTAERVRDEHRDGLAALLQHADRVKFARYAPSPAEIQRFLSSSRAWIESYPPATQQAPPAREAA